MTLSKIIANIQRKVNEEQFSMQTEVEVLIVDKFNGVVVMAEIGKHSVKQLKSMDKFKSKV